MTALDKRVERIVALGAKEAVAELMRCDQAVRAAADNNFHWLKTAMWERNIAVTACGLLGITVKRSYWGNHIEEVTRPDAPVSEYLNNALKEREAVSVPEVGQVKGHGYHDPCDQALINSGRLKDV